ncbi:hypothetical protein Tco_0588137 [Tanacetum coccineum]
MTYLVHTLNTCSLRCRIFMPQLDLPEQSHTCVASKTYTRICSMTTNTCETPDKIAPDLHTDATPPRQTLNRCSYVGTLCPYRDEPDLSAQSSTSLIFSHALQLLLRPCVRNSRDYSTGLSEIRPIVTSARYPYGSYKLSSASCSVENRSSLPASHPTIMTQYMMVVPSSANNGTRYCSPA